MPKKVFVIIAGVFLGVGLAGLVVAGVTYSLTASFLSGAERTTGTVVELDERTTTTRDPDGFRRRSTVWTPVVRFTVDGRTFEYRSNVGSSPPAYDVGESVTVAYDPADPSDARIVGFLDLYLLPLISGGLGAVFTGIGATMVGVRWRRGRRRAWLRQYGRPVDAEITTVRVDTRTRINGRSPLVVHATWHDPLSGQTRTAHSDPVWSDPPPELHVGQRVRVLVDPDRPKRHLVELPER